LSRGNPILNTLALSLENPVTGEHVSMKAPTEETDSAVVKTRTTLPGGATGVLLHYHLSYTEPFTVLEDRLDMCIGGKKQSRRIESGETVHVPSAVSYHLRVSSDHSREWEAPGKWPLHLFITAYLEVV